MKDSKTKSISLSKESLRLLTSIQEVIDALNTHTLKEKKKYESPYWQAVKTSCLGWDELLIRYRDSQREKEKQELLKRKEYIKSIGNLSYVVHRDFLKPLSSLKSNDSFSILNALGKGRDENLHSDFIASLFDVEVVGDFAFSLFEKFVNWKNSKNKWKGSSKYQNVYRERRLDAIFPSVGEEIADHRIDILVESAKSVLVIENKVDSAESDNQTVNYFEVVESAYSKSDYRFYFLLSPYGFSGEQKEFKGISYLDFYKMVYELFLESPPREASGRKFVEVYLQELSNTIMKQQKEATKITEKFLKENGYDID